MSTSTRESASPRSGAVIAINAMSARSDESVLERGDTGIPPPGTEGGPYEERRRVLGRAARQVNVKNVLTDLSRTSLLGHMHVIEFGGDLESILWHERRHDLPIGCRVNLTPCTASPDTNRHGK